jgi:hypothetical protein
LLGTRCSGLGHPYDAADERFTAIPSRRSPWCDLHCQRRVRSRRGSVLGGGLDPIPSRYEPRRARWRGAPREPPWRAPRIQGPWRRTDGSVRGTVRPLEPPPSTPRIARSVTTGNCRHRLNRCMPLSANARRSQRSAVRATCRSATTRPPAGRQRRCKRRRTNPVSPGPSAACAAVPGVLLRWRPQCS